MPPKHTATKDAISQTETIKYIQQENKIPESVAIAKALQHEGRPTSRPLLWRLLWQAKSTTVAFLSPSLRNEATYMNLI